jgi:MFS family permease
MPGVPRAFAPLRHRGFRLLAAGQLTSNVGDAFYAVALPWYVLADHGGALLLGAVLAAYGIPRAAFVTLGGHAADRWRPWTVMMAADAVRVIAIGALAVVALRGPAHAALLVPVAAVLGAGEGMFLPGSFSIVPSLLSDGDLQAGNALTSGGTQLATLVGPAIGGAVVALVGASLAFGVDAVTFAVSVATLAGVRSVQRGPVPPPAPPELPEPPEAPPEQPPEAPEPTLRRLVASERVLQMILLLTVAANLGSGGMGEVALPALAHGPFHAGATGYGALIAGLGGGALCGTLVAAQARRARRPAVVASLAFLAAAACLSAVPYLGGAVAAGVALGGFGAWSGFANVLTLTAFQRWAPPSLLGRLMGVVMIGSFGIFPVSVLLGGVVVHDVGPAPFFPLTAGILAAAVLGGLTQKSWRTFGMTAVAGE